ncbi:MAG: lactonase family protein [Saprospiraceae bacterium]
MKPHLVVCLLAGLLTGCSQPDDAVADYTEVIVGTYTRKEGHVDGKAAGIYLMKVNDQGAIQPLDTLKEVVNPSYIALSKDGSWLFAVSEIGPDVDSTGYVYAYRRTKDRFTFVNRQPTYAHAPCYVSVHPTGKWLYVANYVGGMVARYPLQPEGIGEASDTLRLQGNGPNEARQESAHPHSVTLSPDGQWVVVADLGTDTLRVFQADNPKWAATSVLPLPPGAGPRHIAFHPRLPYAYVLNELLNTVTVLHYNAANGSLHILDHWSTLPTNFTDFSIGADIHLTPDGQYLYASNRGHNSLAAWRIQPEDGRLQPLGHTPTGGDFPRNFTITADGNQLWVANQNTDNVRIFAIDKATGLLEQTGQFEVKTPVCLVVGR